ncbi:MAG: type II toxin-antitoxin system Phd/YefM family antitoxin [Chloroflexi bacterium]|nr:type II toxin-antitoxin system Phd/YefM family antitoxin [Chloroflexota bacterium]
MSQTWQLQVAKNKFSQVVDEAINEGPQIITRHGREVVIILSLEEYRKMMASQQKLSDFFRMSPLVDADLDLSRDQSDIRDEFTL